MTKLGEICEFINGDRGKNYPSGNDIVKEGVPFINAGHIQNNKINLEEMNYITEEKYNNLKACSYDNNNLFLYKRMRGLSKKEDDEKNKVLEEHRKERRALIEKYSKMDFYEITKNFIKDKYSVEVSSDEIKEAIA